MTTERRFTNSPLANVQIIERADDPPMIEGYAAVYYDPTDEGTEYELWEGAKERIAPGAFDRAIADAQDVIGAFNHNRHDVLGRVSADTLTLEADNRGLRYAIPMDAEDPDHTRLAAKLRRGDVRGSSFAFMPTQVRWEKVGDLEIRTIEDLDLIDVGPVTEPAYTATSAGIRATDEGIEAARHERDAWAKSIERKPRPNAIHEQRQKLREMQG
jgi:HK97 family phage prohead protease